MCCDTAEKEDFVSLLNFDVAFRAGTCFCGDRRSENLLYHLPYQAPGDYLPKRIKLLESTEKWGANGVTLPAPKGSPVNRVNNARKEDKTAKQIDQKDEKRTSTSRGERESVGVLQTHGHQDEEGLNKSATAGSGGLSPAEAPVG